jgi:thiosulfate reductase cytochrome b subunit
MRMRALFRFFSLAVATGIACLPSAAVACTVCMGDANSKTAGAMNAAIFLLLGFIFGVLGLLVAFGISLMRRAAAPLPPHAEFSQSDSGADS